VAHEKMMEEFRARKEETERAAREQPPAPAPAAPRFVFRLLEINEASESDLAALPTLGASGAREIVAERGKGRFRDWQDVVRRTMALSQAQSAAYSSVMGLQVNGRSLEGAAADERAATAYAARVLSR